MHDCPRCGKKTDGEWSEGGLKWGICEDCMETERRMAQDNYRSTDDRLSNGLCEDPCDDDHDEYPGGYSDYATHQASKGWCST